MDDFNLFNIHSTLFGGPNGIDKLTLSANWLVRFKTRLPQHYCNFCAGYLCDMNTALNVTTI
jgi:hypothetical protein